MIILDGGLGRHLASMGAPFRQPEWSALALMEAPQMVRDAHDDFISAGADVIATNTYAVVPYHIGEDRYEAQSEELLTLAAKLARDAPMRCRIRSCGGKHPADVRSYKPEEFEVAGRAG